MDETPFWYDHMEKRTIDFVGNNSVNALHTGADKSRFTVTVTIAANGELLDFYVILRGLKNVPAIFRQHPNPFPNVVVAVSMSGTMDEHLMLDYQARVVEPYLNGRPGVLIMDAFKAHFTAVVSNSLESIQVRPHKLPAGYTSYGQMLDVVFNKPMKSLYKSCWQGWFTNRENCRMTSGGNRRRPGHDVVVGWVNQIYNIMSQRTGMIQRSFVCCGLRHPSFPSLNGVEFASNLNGRLQEILFIHGTQSRRDDMLLSIATSSFESHAELVLAIESYISEYNRNAPQIENVVSCQQDPRVIYALE